VKRWLAGTAFVVLVGMTATPAQDFVPVTQRMLENPSPNDWLMYSRTYDAQRFRPLTQITRANVA
jgi:alcohol dehydrogenase (cytochrome c)